MAKFKIGDKVRRISNPHFGGGMNVGSEWVVKSIEGSYFKVEGYDQIVYKEYFKLVVEQPHEISIKQLEALGYTIIPPKPKLTGKIQVILTGSGNICAYRDDVVIADSAKLLAIVDWTEGDGI